jgi:hypothetical protein
MAQLDVRRLYASLTNPKQSQIDAIVDDVETFVNLTKLNDDNILDDGITASTKVIDGTITTAKLQNSSITAAKIAADAVTTVKIADSAVTSAELAADSVTSAKIVAGAITNAKIADANVTKAKIVTPLNISSDVVYSNTFNGESNPTTTAQGSVAVTTTGNPVVVGLMARSSGNSIIQTVITGGASTQIQFQYHLYRDGVRVKTSRQQLAWPQYFQRMTIPPGAFYFVDEPAAGTYTYTFTISVTFSAAVNCDININCRQYAFEVT